MSKKKVVVDLDALNGQIQDLEIELSTLKKLKMVKTHKVRIWDIIFEFENAVCADPRYQGFLDRYNMLFREFTIPLEVKVSVVFDWNDYAPFFISNNAEELAYKVMKEKGSPYNLTDTKKMLKKEFALFKKDIKVFFNDIAINTCGLDTPLVMADVEEIIRRNF